MDPATELVARNTTFAKSFAYAGRTAAPDLGTVIVTCVDPRVDPAHTLGIRVGEAAVIRTVGGRVSERVLDDLALYAHFIGPAADELTVLVVHHTECGAARLADPDVREAAASAGISPQRLEEIASADPSDSVGADVERIVRARRLSPSARIGGYVYDVSDGTISEVVSPTEA
jgi:carbonic anhydrase